MDSSQAYEIRWAKVWEIQNGYHIEMELNKLHCAVMWIELDEAHKHGTNEKMRENAIVPTALTL